MSATLRPEQRAILNYRGGKMAVSAVPGSGKTFTLAALATELLRAKRISGDGEILVVTFTNSAVDNIRARIRRMLTEAGLTDAGYRVHTLHGLALSILRERPDLAGTGSEFIIDDELSGRSTMPDAVRGYTQIEQPDYWRSFIPGDMSQSQRERVEDQWSRATNKIGLEVTRLAKNLRLTPADLNRLIAQSQTAHAADQDFDAPPISPFLRIGAAIYARYQNILALGGRLDFDDLIWGAIRALENDDAFRAGLGARFQFILEDEAQDSTPLQERILAMLSREHGNWARVGDPNQAIMTTFTASDVRFFREFGARDDVVSLPLSRSGRSAQPIIDMANRLAEWAVNEHPEPEVRATALAKSPQIRPTDADDAQQNPPAESARIHVQAFADDGAEANRVAVSAAKFVLENESATCAILSPTNYFGHDIVEELIDIEESYRAKGKLANRRKPLHQDQLRNSSPVRAVARLLAVAVRFCAMPTNGRALNELREALVEAGQLAAAEDDKRMATLVKSAMVERVLFPAPVEEPILPAAVSVSDGEQRQFARLARVVEKWVRASLLPVDQLILTIAQDTFSRENDLAIAHSLAVSLRRVASVTPNLQLLDVSNELTEIADNKQKYMSNALIEAGFEPEPGVVTVTTMHKAKGLEWDRVYLVSVDQQEFPHDAGGNFRGSQWYLGGRDPATEARKQLEQLVAGRARASFDLVREARVEYIAERLRLLYVGITRAKRDLIISFSQRRGRNDDNKLAEALIAIG